MKGAAPGENTNYRSAHDIVRLNNMLFYSLAQGPDGSHLPGYSGVAQSLTPKTADLEAWIEILDLTDGGMDNTVKEIVERPDSGLTADDVERLVAAGAYEAAEVAMLLTARKIIGEISRGYRQSDIAIICSKNADCARIAEYINRNYSGVIRLVSEEAILLKNSSAVKLVLSILEIIDRSLENNAVVTSDSINGMNLFEEENEKKGLLRSYTLRRRRSILADTFEYHIARGVELRQALSLAIEAANAYRPDEEDADRRGGKEVKDAIDEIRADRPLDLPSLVQSIIKHKVSPATQAAEMPFIAAFVDFVDEFCANYTPSIHALLTHWNEKKDTLAVPPGSREDAVTVSTVHKAKGLEWACVHIPFMKWDIEKSPRGGWYDTSHVAPCAPPIMYLESKKELGCAGSPLKEQYDRRAGHEIVDNINVAYVAFTRAVRELHVCMTGKANAGTMSEALIRKFVMPPALTEPAEIYLDLAPYVRGTSLLLGSPTVPADKKEEPRARKAEPNGVCSPAPFRVSFGLLDKCLTTYDELVDPMRGTPYDDIADDEPREVTDPWEGDGPMPESYARATADGIAMHSILSSMRVVDDLDTAISQRRRDYSEEQLETYRGILQKALETGGEHVKRWFSPDNPRVLNEQSIYSPLTGRTTRADRMTWLPDGTVEVVDYKFTSRILPKHADQARDYALVLKKIGEERVKAYLWYPLLGEVREVEV